jgi:protein MpaA
MMYRTIAALLLVSTLWGCQASDSTLPGIPRAADRDSTVLLATPTMTPPTKVAGHSVENRPTNYRVWGHGTTRVLIIATIHGDEPAGTPLVEQLERRLAADTRITAGRSVIIVPIANPDGYAARSRSNARGVDLNRNFPAESFKATRRHGDAPLSEPESRALYELVRRFRPDRIVSIHQPLRCVDYDGPGKALAETMSRAGDLPVRKLGARPGSFGSFAGVEEGIPTITLELPGGAHRRSETELWDTYGSMLLAAIAG